MRRFPIIVNGEIRYAEAGITVPRADIRASGSGHTLIGRPSSLWQRALAWPWWRTIFITAVVIVSLIALFALLTALGPQWGPLLLICAGIAAVFCGLGTRQAGTLSAYSLFNAGYERLPGQLSADDIDREVRGGGGVPLQRPPAAPLGQGQRLGGRAQAALPMEGNDGQADDDSDEERQLQAALQRSLLEK